MCISTKIAPHIIQQKSFTVIASLRRKQSISFQKNVYIGLDAKAPCPLCVKELKIVSLGPHIKKACPVTKEAREKEREETRKKEQERREKEREESRRENRERKEKWHTTAEWKERKKFKKEYPILFSQFETLMKHIHCECTCSKCSRGWSSSGCSCSLGSDKPWYDRIYDA